MTSSGPYARLVKRAASLFQGRAFAEAEQTARQILAQFGEEANALMILGLIRLDASDFSEAAGFLERAQRVNPTHVHVLSNLGNVYRAQGRLIDARRVLEEALQIDKKFSAAHNNLGNVLLALNERAAAKRSYERAAKTHPAYADPIANLARLAEEEHRLSDALALSGRALALEPQHRQARLTQARVVQRQGDPTKAAELLSAMLLDKSMTLTNRIVAQGFLGEALDKLGHYDNAFAAFARANDLQLKSHSEDYGHDLGYVSPHSVARLARFVASEDVSAWSVAPPAEPVPVFLIGFPRSGTTLLDQILASHPDVTTLEERESLMEPCHRLIGSEAEFARWKDLSASEINALRAQYWRYVRAGLGRAPLKRVFIDKLPLNAVLLPVIYRLFPTAKIILALRDPRDVIVSCYQQRFGMNAAMYQLLKFETAVGYYDAVMSLVVLCERRFNLNIREIKYEAVVSNFDQSVANLLTFLDLPWNAGVRDFAVTARSRAIGTPSAVQVVQPLYASSHGKWRNYQKYLQPHLSELAPWVATFGYEP